MKKFFVLCVLLGCTAPLYGQKFAIKNNLLYDMAITPNLGVEIKLSEKSTLNLSGGYNPFNLGEYKRIKHWLVRPEYRYWFCERFNGTFLGVHLHGGEFSVGGIKLPFDLWPGLEHNKYEGYYYGGGITIGHQWILSKRWSIEAAFGLGYVRAEMDKYPNLECGDKLDSRSLNYWGPTTLAVSFIYFIK